MVLQKAKKDEGSDSIQSESEDEDAAPMVFEEVDAKLAYAVEIEADDFKKGCYIRNDSPAALQRQFQAIRDYTLYTGQIS